MTDKLKSSPMKSMYNMKTHNDIIYYSYFSNISEEDIIYIDNYLLSNNDSDIVKNLKFLSDYEYTYISSLIRLTNIPLGKIKLFTYVIYYVFTKMGPNFIDLLFWLLSSIVYTILFIILLASYNVNIVNIVMIVFPCCGVFVFTLKCIRLMIRLSKEIKLANIQLKTACNMLDIIKGNKVNSTNKEQMKMR